MGGGIICFINLKGEKMKKLLFSGICISALAVCANAGTYSGLNFGYINNSKSIGPLIKGVNWDINGYIRTYKEHISDSELVWGLDFNYLWANKKIEIYDNTTFTLRNYQFDMNLLLGYGIYVDEEEENFLSVNFMGGLGYHNLGVRNGSSYGIKALKFGISALSKPFEYKPYSITLDAYYNFYIDNDYFDDLKNELNINKSKSAYDVSLGMLFNTTKSRFSPYISTKIGLRDNLFSQRNTNAYINLGVGFHF